MTLADGSPWYLPRIDFSLVCTASGLRADFLEAFRLAQEVRSVEEFSPQLVRYQLHVINIGSRLLAINYDVSDTEWKRLLQFDRLIDAFQFTRAVSTALGDSWAAWGPTAAAMGEREFSIN